MKNNRTLHLLIMEDSDQDTNLLVYTLRQGGFALEFLRVDSLQELTLALHQKHWEIAISDYYMPNLLVEDALKLWQSSMGEAPFIVLSGAAIYDEAVSLLRAGAHDFIRKDKLARLIPVIERELREAEGRRKRMEAEHAVQQLNLSLERQVKERTEELQKSLTALHETQSKLVESQKMAALGCLVSGVAHEINTPLGVGIAAATHLASATKRLTEKAGLEPMAELPFADYVKLAAESSDLIYISLNKIAGLVQSFKNIAGDQYRQERKIFNLSEKLEEVLITTQSLFNHTQYTITCHCLPDLVIQSCPEVVSEILTNLITNSLIHGFENREQGDIEIIVSEQDDRLCMIFRDNGNGMEQPELDRLFEPFFTTKRGQGHVGLGMHIVYNLVNHTLGGQIHCQSQPGKGSHFEIVIPSKVV